VMAQIVYYFWAGLALGAPDRPVGFSVPTGNFGNVFAGYAARLMGLPIERLVVASNSNDILTRFFESGVMQTTQVVPTLSPSMDIQVSSNFERLMALTVPGGGAAVAALMQSFRRDGTMSLPDSAWQAMRAVFSADRFDDAATLETMRQIKEKTGETLDPHSAIGVAAALRAEGVAGLPLVALATAHPAKFPDAVERATGLRPGLPPHLADLFERPERSETIGNDAETLKTAVRAFAGRNRP